MRPRSSCLRVASSRSEANCANAASSRYWASARRTPPPVSLRFMILVCAAPPTRDTEMPALIAGRMPALNRSVSRKIWPSVIEITLVGTNAVTSPAWVSMIGSAVSEPVLPLTAPLVNFSTYSSLTRARALEQARVQIEHVAGVGFAARRTAQQQRDLAVGPRLLGQVVIDDQRVLAAVAEVLAHGAAGIGRDVLHRRRLGGGGGDDDGVGHGAVFFELAHHVGDGRGFLPDRDVDAEQVLALLIDDGVDRHRGFAGLAVADDQLALAAADRHHRVDRLEAGLHRLRHRFARNHARRDFLDDVGQLGIDRAFAVDRLPERIDHAPDQFGTDGHRQNRPVHLTVSPSVMCSYSPSTTAPTESRSRFSARPKVLFGNSSISPCMTSASP